MLTNLLTSLVLSYIPLEVPQDQSIWILSGEQNGVGIYTKACDCGCDTEEELSVFVEEEVVEGEKMKIDAFFGRIYGSIEVVGSDDEGNLVIEKGEEDLPEIIALDPSGYAKLEPLK